MCLDGDDNVVVADWRNDRIQSFTSDGKWLASFGTPGTGGDTTNARVKGGITYSDAPVGQFNRPTGVCVDEDGDIYIADWLNNRVQVLTPEGRFITEFTGDGHLSNMGIAKLRSNPDMIKQRNGIQNFTPERVLWAPCAVRIARNNRVISPTPPATASRSTARTRSLCWSSTTTNHPRRRGTACRAPTLAGNKKFAQRKRPRSNSRPFSHL